MKLMLYSPITPISAVVLLMGGLAAPSASSQEVNADTLILENRASLPAAATVDKATILRHLERRERLAAEANAEAAGADQSAEAGPAGQPQINSVDVGEFNFVQRNFRNTVAQTRSSTLAEPAAAKDDTEVLYMGNTYISRSANNGATWTAETVPAGPSFAPFACCDPDAVHHAGLDTTFANLLYLNSSGTDGAIRIFVRQGTISGGNDCVYTFNPAGTTTVPDYPHLGVSNGFLYLSINRLDSKGTPSINDDTWIGSSVVRINASQASSCVAAPAFNTFTFSTGSQRVFTPVENATTTMYWGAVNTSTSFRIFRWPESASSPTQFLRSGLHASNFVNPDCRGGTGDFDWIERSTAWSITGFRLRGAVGGGNLLFLWNVGADSSHVQGHIHAAAFRESDLALVAQPHVFSQTTCTGFPAVSANSQGDFALSQGAGGRAGGLAGATPCSTEATCAGRGYISIDDQDTAGIFFAVRSLTASGTHNRSDGRFGDYFTVRKADNCPLAWAATNYSLLNGNTSASHVNARYVELRSSRDPACP
jgi:hypothetical protein